MSVVYSSPERRSVGHHEKQKLFNRKKEREISNNKSFFCFMSIKIAKTAGFCTEQGAVSMLNKTCQTNCMLY
jgi:hypothetical protein